MTQSSRKAAGSSSPLPKGAEHSVATNDAQTIIKLLQSAEATQHAQLAKIQEDVAAIRSDHASEVLQLKNLLLDAQRQLHDCSVAAFELTKELHSAKVQVTNHQQEISILQQQLIDKEKEMRIVQEASDSERTTMLLELQSCKTQLGDIQMQQQKGEATQPQIRDGMSSWQRSAALKRPRSEESKKVSFPFSTPPNETMDELDQLQRNLPFRTLSRTASPI
jgi:hypothetical protein